MFFTALLLLSAWNSGNNILYLAFAICFSIGVCAEVMSRLNFKPPKVDILVPEQVTRGEEVTIWVRVENLQKRFPLYGISIELVIEDVKGKQTRLFLGKVPMIPARDGVELSFQQVFMKRGLIKITEVIIKSEFPLGIIEKQATYKITSEVLVVPKTQYLNIQTLGNYAGGSRVPTRTLISESGDYYSVREYQPGDDLRYIAWKISARLGIWLVREWALSLPNKYLIYLDLRKRSDSDDELFETMIDFVASLAFSLIMKQFHVGIWTDMERIPTGHGIGHLNLILKRLALVQAIESKEIDEALWNKYFQEGRNSRLLLLSVNPELWGKSIVGMRILNPDVIKASK
ncbi:MAG TPA: DUF58 domain-containing protein [Candidatus Hydrogenedens sp.]|nr:DUF58 domain-containing protein [Candidatus Hydrogenedens sp.]HOL20134.1 DUF58 domain-containing protein [Candidatus Hydrogenedens sp.]HPP58556.1 DUF58 domain-containing protein [Candidatus Hydrogenedens sp.]